MTGKTLSPSLEQLFVKQHQEELVRLDPQVGLYFLLQNVFAY